MRKYTILTCSLLINAASAQLQNGSFEEPIWNGWQMPPCMELQMAPSSDTPGGTGLYSLQVLATEAPLCPVTFDLVQPIPWLTPGPWTLSYWYKGHGGFGPPARVMVAYYHQGGAPSLTSGWMGGNTTAEWSYMEEQFYWDGIDPPVDSLIVLIAGGADITGTSYSYFDEIWITSPTTSIETDRSAQLPLRPNPATDKVWLALASPVIRVDAIDALGRMLPIENVQLENGTLQLNIAALPPGPVLLRIEVPDSVKWVRFMKA